MTSEKVTASSFDRGSMITRIDRVARTRSGSVRGGRVRENTAVGRISKTKSSSRKPPSERKTTPSLVTPRRRPNLRQIPKRDRTSQNSNARSSRQVRKTRKASSRPRINVDLLSKYAAQLVEETRRKARNRRKPDKPR